MKKFEGDVAAIHAYIENTIMPMFSACDSVAAAIALTNGVISSWPSGADSDLPTFISNQLNESLDTLRTSTTSYLKKDRPTTAEASTPPMLGFQFE